MSSYILKHLKTLLLLASLQNSTLDREFIYYILFCILVRPKEPQRKNIEFCESLSNKEGFFYTRSNYRCRCRRWGRSNDVLWDMNVWTSRDGTFCSLNKSLVLQYDHVSLMAHSLPFNSFLLPEAESLYLLQQSRMKEKRKSRSEELEPTQPCRCILSIAQGYAIKMSINTKECIAGRYPQNSLMFSKYSYGKKLCR